VSKQCICLPPADQHIYDPDYNQLALGIDIFIVGGISITHIFFEQRVNWEETITLDRRCNIYALYGWQLLTATSADAHS